MRVLRFTHGRGLWAMILLVSAILTVTYFTPRRYSSSLQIKARDLLLGEVWRTSEHVVSLPISNISDSAVAVKSILTSCTCTEISPSLFSIAPGETKRLQAVIDLSKASRRSTVPQPFSVALMVSTEEGSQFFWQLTGRIRPHVLDCASVMDLGNYLVGQPGPAVAYMIESDEAASPQGISVESPPDVVATIAREEDGKHVVRFQLTDNALKRAGWFRRKVSFTARGTDCPPLSVTVQWQVEDIVSAEPAVIAFGPMRVGTWAEETITLHCRPLARYKMLEIVQPADSGTEANVKVVDPNRLLIQIRQFAKNVGQQKNVVCVPFRVFHDEKPSRMLSVEIPITYHGTAAGDQLDDRAIQK